MPRRPRFCPKNVPAHIIQRGNNRQAIFAAESDLAAYAHWLREAAVKFQVNIHGWVFMTNHVHLLLTPSTDSGISKLIQSLGLRYSRHFNYTYARTGSLYDGRFKSCLVEDHNYLLTCLQYIELNPLRAGMVTDPGNYSWSSYRSHAFGVPVKMWSPHPLYRSLGENPKQRQQAYRQRITQQLDQAVITKIRHCINTGMALGSDKFKAQIHALTN